METARELLICSDRVRQRLANVKLSHSPRRYARTVDCRCLPRRRRRWATNADDVAAPDVEGAVVRLHLDENRRLKEMVILAGAFYAHHRTQFFGRGHQEFSLSGIGGRGRPNTRAGAGAPLTRT